MIGKEALNELYKIIDESGFTNNSTGFGIVMELIETIQKDLERLKKLENENKQLKAKLDRSLPKIVIRNTLDNVLPSLEDENEKLKQKIEQIKSLPNCDMCNEDWFSCMCLRKKIEEVLIDE